MSNDTKQALLSLESQIGFPPGTEFRPSAPDADLVIDPSQRQNVISWLIIRGLDPANAKKNSLLTLGKLYRIEKYLDSALLSQERDSKRKPGKQIRNITSDWGDPPAPPKFPNIEINKSTPPLTSPTTTPTSPDLDAVKILVKGLISSEKNDIFITIRQILEEENQKIKTKVIEIGRDTAHAIATTIVEEKIKHENQNLKSLIEDIIFQTYLNHKKDNSPTERGERSKPDHAEVAQTQNTSTQHIPTLDPNYHFDPYATKVIRAALSMSENLYVYGDTGCGKTTHLEQVCAVLSRGLIRINPHDGITREMFLGGMKLINNETIFIEGALPTAMRNGLVFLVDEISFLPPNLTAILNPIGERGGKLYIPETGEWLSPQPGFCIFATDNTGGKGDRTGNYTGTEVQNTATLDRFAFCIKMDYLPIDKEIKMLINRFPHQDINEIQKLLNLARDIRAAFSRGELALTLSTRKLIKFFSQRQNGFTIEESLSNTILSWLDEDDETLVKTMIDRLQVISPGIS